MFQWVRSEVSGLNANVHALVALGGPNVGWPILDPEGKGEGTCDLLWACWIQKLTVLTRGCSVAGYSPWQRHTANVLRRPARSVHIPPSARRWHVFPRHGQGWRGGCQVWVLPTSPERLLPEAPFHPPLFFALSNRLSLLHLHPTPYSLLRLFLRFLFLQSLSYFDIPFNSVVQELVLDIMSTSLGQAD